MNIKQRRLIKHFLEMLKGRMESEEVNEIDPVFLIYFTKSELIDIVHWLYPDIFDKKALARISNTNLLKSIGNDMNVLSYTIYRWNVQLKATPAMSQLEVHEFFDQIQIDPHYLRDKPVEQWDGYDRSNYYSILYKHGKTRRVFAIFTSDVDDKDKYAVTTQPSYFFDTQEEAKQELQRILQEKNFKLEDLKIMSLWKIN